MSEEKEQLYKGVAIGGPFDGRQLESRFPSGVLVVSVPEALAWVYDYADTPDGGQFECRDRDSANGGAKRFEQRRAQKAAEGNAYDVRAVDDGEVTEEVGR